MTNPSVSVFIASFNGERFVEETVRSVLGQTWRDLEVVIVDDGSGEPTLSILRRLAAEDARVRLFEAEHRGQIGTLNAAIEACRGRYIARLDHDDVALPTRIERQVSFLEANPRMVACGTNIQEIDAEGRYGRRPNTNEHVLEHRPDAFPPKLQWMPGPTPMFRAAELRRVGGYRTQFKAAEDRDLCWRIGALGPCARFGEALVLHRVHGGNLSLMQLSTQLFSHVLSDFSALAAHYGRDDRAILAAIEPGGDYAPHIAAYKTLLAGDYPVETFWLNFLVRYSAWPLVGYASRLDVFVAVARHLAQRPFDPLRIALMRRAAKYLPRDPDVAVPPG
jgi:glycosyltransferase involved in cell wall biosynthesis